MRGRCLECGGEIVARRQHIATQRGTLTEEWAECEWCGEEDDRPFAAPHAREAEAEERAGI